MKTAISIPDDTFERADRRAHDLGISRSEFFTVAARRYLDELDTTALAEQIDRAAHIVNDARSSADAVAVGHTVLSSDDDW